jgi:hypothetical protein
MKGKSSQCVANADGVGHRDLVEDLLPGVDGTLARRARRVIGDNPLLDQPQKRFDCLILACGWRLIAARGRPGAHVLVSGETRPCARQDARAKHDNPNAYVPACG